MQPLKNKNKQLDLSSPIVMGILNATPDSFYDTKCGQDEKGLMELAKKMLNDGASILDIGGASTKPGQPLIDANEELKRVIPTVTAIRKQFPDVWLSVDTYNSRVAKAAVEAGADIVNDISSGAYDKDMFHTVAALQVPYIAMHIQGTPETMQLKPEYDNVVPEVLRALRQTIRKCEEAGIEQVIVDPGFGFGKTVEHNYELLRMLGTFATLGKPILAGISRKSIVCKALKVNPSHALNGTTALNMAALMNGANILRVHDVKEAMEVVKLFNLLNG